MAEDIMEFIFTLVPLAFIIAVIYAVNNKTKNKRGNRKPQTVSSDSHVIKPEDDPTCAKYGHVHDEIKHRYIVHDEPVEGYVNLNGRLMTLKEAAKY